MENWVAELVEWYRRSARDLPWRRPGFGAWGVLVSEFMLQQTPVNRVVPHLEAWLERWPSPAALAAEPPAEAVRQWSNLGYPRRALWLHRASVEITARFGGVVPRSVTDLLSLPGIGDYTARAVAAFAYSERHPVVDTNTRRVLARVVDGRAQPTQPSGRNLVAMESLLPPDPPAAARFNAATMELGATVCTARTPACTACPISDSCLWRALGHPDTPDVRTRQARYEGSDRQARGGVLRTLRHARGTVPLELILPDWPDAAQRERAIASLVADGLVEPDGDGLRLPT